MKLSVVGCEASGKTVFMSALADYYTGGERPCLVPENSSANNFQRFQLRQMRCLHQWPPATDPGKTIELKWTLRQNGNVLCNIDMLEFGGETFREAFRGGKAKESHQASVDVLKKHLGKSEFVVVLVSLKDLLRDQGSMTTEEFERDTEALWVTRGLLDFINHNVPNARIVIGLTQADLHRGEIAAAGGARELFRQRWPSVAAVAYDYPIIPIASVSATDANGNPAPDYTTDGILPVMEEFKKSLEEDNPKKAPAAHDAPARQEDEPVNTSNVSRTTLLLLLLLLCTFLFWCQFWYGSCANWQCNSGCAYTATPKAATSNITTKATIATNTVEKLPSVPSMLPLTPDANALRTWHDHNGAAIDARWVSTSSDFKRIILETTYGRKIRASIRKFSTEDQQYIAEQLNSLTNSTHSTL